MPYKITLDVYVSEEQTWPRISVETNRDLQFAVNQGSASMGASPEETVLANAVLDDVTTFARKIARTSELKDIPAQKVKSKD